MFVYSTLTTDMKYEQYTKPVGGALPRVARSVFVRGGANRADRMRQSPAAVGTEISDDDAAFLRAHETFKGHEKGGFVLLTRTREEPEVVAAMMARGDKSRQLVPEDFVKADQRGKVNVPSAALV